MKLNCDVGESFGAWSMGNDAELMPYIDMANIACGFHASDPQIMDKTIALALDHDVTVGAHPGYPDLLGFGRKAMAFSPAELINITLYQVGALQALCHARGTVVAYVKPHGALYHSMMRDSVVFQAVLKAVTLLEGDVALMVMATDKHKHYHQLAEQAGVSLWLEAFCDRAYQGDGQLQARSEVGAVFADIETITSQAKGLIAQQQVTASTGETIAVAADTLCIHGDSSLALASAQAIRSLLS